VYGQAEDEGVVDFGEEPASNISEPITENE